MFKADLFLLVDHSRTERKATSPVAGVMEHKCPSTAVLRVLWLLADTFIEKVVACFTPLYIRLALSAYTS